MTKVFLHQPAQTTYDLDGLRHAVDDHHQPPAALTVSTFRRMSASRRTAWLEQRWEHLARSAVVMTPTMADAFTDVHLMCKLNQFRPDDREVYLISGGSGVGKTTIARTIAVNIERDVARRQPEYRRLAQIPVVMIATPARCTPTTFDRAILTYLHQPFGPRHSHSTLKTSVIDTLRNHRVSVVIVDDLHRLKHRDSGNVETADLLKEYYDLTPCTYVYLGVDLTSSGFFRGDAGQQILNRGALLQVEPFSNEAGPARQQWRAVVQGLENNLRLLRHRPGTLTTDPMLQLLYERTHGKLGALNKLIQTAAAWAVEHEDEQTRDLRDYGITGSERITRPMLKHLKTVAAAELESRQRRATGQ